MFGLATALATACAPALGLALMDRMGFSVLFAVAAGCAVLSLVLLALMKLPKAEEKKIPLSFRGLLDKDALPASVTALVFIISTVKMNT